MISSAGLVCHSALFSSRYTSCLYSFCLRFVLHRFPAAEAFCFVSVLIPARHHPSPSESLHHDVSLSAEFILFSDGSRAAPSPSRNVSRSAWRRRQRWLRGGGVSSSSTGPDSCCRLGGLMETAVFALTGSVPAAPSSPSPRTPAGRKDTALMTLCHKMNCFLDKWLKI